MLYQYSFFETNNNTEYEYVKILMVRCRNKEKGQKKKKKRATGHGMHEIAWGVIMIFVSQLRDYRVFVIFL